MIQKKTQKHRGEGNVKRETQNDVMQTKAKESLEPPKAGIDKNRFFPGHQLRITE